ncbi:MAG: helix-turn-helix domain-containing protein [Bacteroidetes bacterium]|nr:helix-turn-helix domain-containing protein [Bacteroidota bacterium]
MKLHEQLQLLNRLHHLIRRKATGTPAQLAQRLDISERTVYNQIRSLKELGAEIKYCKTRQSYYYCKAVEFNFKLLISEEKLSKLEGGQKFSNTFFSTAKFLQPNTFSLCM